MTACARVGATKPIDPYLSHPRPVASPQEDA